MMFRIFVAAFLLTSYYASAMKYALNGDGNIYQYIIQALDELKLRELSENKSFNSSPTVQHASSVCYDELGCFDKEGTFKHLKQLPEPPETVNTHFLLYTRKNQEIPQIMDYKKPETVRNSNINPKGPLRFITHGFSETTNKTWIWEMKNAFLKREDSNVIIIDWSLAARVPYYIGASVNSELVGAQVGVLFYMIKDIFGMQEKDLHVIGYSLGAHAAGFVGKRMMQLRGTKPGRITGLDPAAPLFADYGEGVYLNKGDAEYVDIIHTNADKLLYGGIGMWKAVGHVDYYPNGGKRQPGCGSTIVGAFIDVFRGNNSMVCNHERSVHLFTESILHPIDCHFTSYRCENYSDFESAKCLCCSDECGKCGKLGYDAEGFGTYYLMTKGDTPYCADVNKLTVHYSNNVKKSYGSLILTLIGPNDVRENITIAGKSDKLLPGTEKVLAFTLGNKLLPIKDVTVLYLKYKGWLTKGTDTYALSSVTMHDRSGKSLYQTCDGDIVLQDKEYKSLGSSC